MSKMSTAQMQARIAELEARLASTGEPGRIWPDTSKAVKDGKAETSPIVFRGVNANPRFTTNMYPSQFARFVSQLPSIVKAVRGEKLWPRLSFRSDEEREQCEALLDAYLEGRTA